MEKYMRSCGNLRLVQRVRCARSCVGEGKGGGGCHALGVGVGLWNVQIFRCMFMYMCISVLFVWRGFLDSQESGS